MNKNRQKKKRPVTLFLSILTQLHPPECLSEHNGPHGSAESYTLHLTVRPRRKHSAAVHCGPPRLLNKCGSSRTGVDDSEVQTPVIAFEVGGKKTFPAAAMKRDQRVQT